MATHHDEHASENGDPAEHGEDISPSFTTLLLPFGLLIGVTFSTPTPVINNDRANALLPFGAPPLSAALHMPTTLSLTGRGDG
jgi:hypothetical protein